MVLKGTRGCRSDGDRRSVICRRAHRLLLECDAVVLARVAAPPVAARLAAHSPCGPWADTARCTCEQRAPLHTEGTDRRASATCAGGRCCRRLHPPVPFMRASASSTASNRYTGQRRSAGADAALPAESRQKQTAHDQRGVSGTALTGAAAWPHRRRPARQRRAESAGEPRGLRFRTRTSREGAPHRCARTPPGHSH